MNQYIGTKIINVKPMNRLEYIQLRGWTLPDDENGLDEGFLVEYVDGGQANTTEYSNYISWSPKDVFERSYKASGKMSFSGAIEFLKLGHKVSRIGWNGKGMYLVYFSPLEHGFADAFEIRGEMKPLLPFIVMKTADDMYIPWLASQADMLSNDWEIV